MPNAVRVRFAPSPTGALHIGGVRTALYNYLFARKHQGQFILRIDDTDQARFVPDAEAYIGQALQWLGITPDESPLQGGAFGPYKQSERKDIYQTHIQQLINTGKAYYAFDTPEALAAMRERMHAAGIASPKYNALSRTSMHNALTMPPAAVTARIQRGDPYVIRLRVPPNETVTFYDHIRGWMRISTATLDDKVLLKSDGFPTYHFATVVDDHCMHITHVIRGEEWLPSTPIHLLLYHYLGWEAAIPQFVHLPLLLSPTGKGKLSKRDTATYGFPIVPMDWNQNGVFLPGFREQGYLPEALLNFLALLGWNPGSTQEIFTKEALIHAFSLERLGKSSMVFDIKKARWVNQQHLHAQPESVHVRYLAQALQAHGVAYTTEQIQAVCRLVNERVVFPQDFWTQGHYFFQPPSHYDAPVMRHTGTQAAYTALQAFATTVRTLQPYDAATLRQHWRALLKTHQLTMGQATPLLRVALTGIQAGPDLMQSMALIGQAESIRRIMAFLAQYHTPEQHISA